MEGVPPRLTGATAALRCDRLPASVPVSTDHWLGELAADASWSNDPPDLDSHLRDGSVTS